MIAASGPSSLRTISDSPIGGAGAVSASLLGAGSLVAARLSEEDCDSHRCCREAGNRETGLQAMVRRLRGVNRGGGMFRCCI